ncbi:hypothetical protein [Cellulomonas sp. NS3]|uniref:hypothetical protein n=1 Tax=Cellulomonas sp. NS3 TaxID=2973977 RepID=UPI0021620800|nr:hypothetical protein [Cellulomonas sp. NS3]
MLKTNFDNGRDHLAMFEPFVEDTLIAEDLDGKTAADVQAAVAERHRLMLPLATVRTLLSRAGKRSLIRREGGRYFTTQNPSRVGTKDLLQLRMHVEERQARLAEAFRRHANEHQIDIESREASLKLLIGFVERHHVRLALAGPDDVKIGVDAGAAGDASFDRLIATFLTEAALKGSTEAEVFAEILEGYVLQNTLLLADISTAERPFLNLHVFFDSNLLFGALGLQGEGNALLSGEFISLLRERGARPEVFKTTVREMRAILALYESKLGSHAGRKSLYQTDITRHLLTTGATPADMRTANSLLERSLSELGVTVVDTPTHVAAYTLDEAELANRLAAHPGGDRQPRVLHDVDCIAAILTLRAGMEPESLDQAKAVFVTSSALTVRNATSWFRDEDGAGIPPILHYFTMSNFAWLKKPAGAASLKMHELIALCGAALRPTRNVWEAFLSNLNRLEESSVVSSDEVAAIMANSLTDRLLADEDIGNDPDASTLTEVVERVKESLIGEAADRVADTDRKVAKLEDERTRQEAVTTARAKQVGNIVAHTAAAALIASFTLGTFAGVQSIALGRPSAWSILFGAAPLAIGALLGVLWGFNVRTWREKVAARCATAVARWLSADERTFSGS